MRPQVMCTIEQTWGHGTCSASPPECVHQGGDWARPSYSEANQKSLIMCGWETRKQGEKQVSPPHTHTLQYPPKEEKVHY